MFRRCLCSRNDTRRNKKKDELNESYHGGMPKGQYIQEEEKEEKEEKKEENEEKKEENEEHINKCFSLVFLQFCNR